ncbi:unnamed protein product, partial [Polarella glacialis]
VAALGVSQLPWLASLSLRQRCIFCLVAAYLPSYFNGSEKRPGSRSNSWLFSFLQNAGRRVLSQLFDIGFQLEAPEALAACDQCIVAVHPHGVLSMGHFLVFSGFDAAFDKAAPATCRCALSAGILFRIPLLRELALAWGGVDAHRDIAKRCLSSGLSLSVVPGGEREQLMAQRGSTEHLVLKNRQGFVRLALQHGVPLVPVYVFGEAQLFRQSQFLFGFRAWIQRNLGVALVMPYGPGGVPCLPFGSTPVRVVVGSPLKVPRLPQPSPAEIEEHHSRYIRELTDLFERNKVAAGYGDRTLKII